jgi:hypothetical protein
MATDNKQPAITREVFEREWQENSGLTDEQMQAIGVCASRCCCGEDGCRGWAMLTPDKYPRLDIASLMCRLN